MTEQSDERLVTAQHISKVYRNGDIESWALRSVSLEITAGEFVAIVGPSGSGKTTFLNLVGALDAPTDGVVNVLGSDLAKLSKRQRADIRLHNLGFVFQAYNLVPVLTALENVEFVLELQGMGPERRSRAADVLKKLGLSDLAHRRPQQMSGGQQQRVAVARAVASNPRLVLADEPTANLDHTNAEVLLNMMKSLNREHAITFIFATHDPRVIAHAQRIVTLEDGRIVSDQKKT